MWREHGGFHVWLGSFSAPMVALIIEAYRRTNGFVEAHELAMELACGERE